LTLELLALHEQAQILCSKFIFGMSVEPAAEICTGR
jgi:hypothetical protein